MSDNNLDLLKTEIQSLVATGATMPQIQDYLNHLWDNSPEDSEERAIISATWSGLLMIDKAVGLANTAVAVAVEMTEQRNLIADDLAKTAQQHNELKEAVRDVDTENPMVSALVENVEEMVWDYIVELERDGIHTDSPGEDIVNSGVFGDMFDADHINMLDDFACILFGFSRNLPEGMMERLGEFIAEFTSEAQELWEVEITKETAEREKKMKELQLLRQQQELTSGSR